MKIGVLGAGSAGSMIAIRLANLGYQVDLIDRQPFPITEASLHNEGKLHFGYVYAADTTKKTAMGVAEGSLSFLDTLSKELEVPSATFSKSQPFYYGVPHDSLLSPEDIADHFSYVDTLIEGHLAASKPVAATDYNAIGFDPDQFQLVMQTQEISVDTAQVGRLIAGCVGSHPNINFRSRTQVQNAATSGDKYRVKLAQVGGDEGYEDYDAVFNCLWGGRLQLDRHLGLDISRPHLMRYKVAIKFDGIRDLARIPSVTLMLGEYGDVVNHGNGSYYLSWYPVCKIAETVGDNPDELFAAFDACDKEGVVRRSIDALAQFIPSIQEFHKHLNRASVHGGIICSWGHEPIPDLDAEIHQRFDVGVNRSGNWFSIDTGKYCMGPNMALEAVDRLLA
ncbi:MAG: FAD-dependent oxidoreductase [Rhodobacteraceae bacterium]|nr:FAD-dependent oxidoreductase [Paracoccaceae bacterium]